MSIFGLQVLDTVGSSNLVTPDTTTIVASGTLIMSDSLNVDTTYGEDIDLPGGSAIPVSKIAVIIAPHENMHFKCWCHYWAYGFAGNTKYPPNFYAYNDLTYYTKADVSGVMTQWTPGNFTLGDETTWDATVGMFPIVGWDRTTASTITKVRIWAAAANIVFDASVAASKVVYSIGAEGIKKVDYAVFLREWDY